MEGGQTTARDWTQYFIAPRAGLGWRGRLQAVWAGGRLRARLAPRDEGGSLRDELVAGLEEQPRLAGERFAAVERHTRVDPTGMPREPVSGGAVPATRRRRQRAKVIRRAWCAEPSTRLQEAKCGAHWTSMKTIMSACSATRRKSARRFTRGSLPLVTSSTPPDEEEAEARSLRTLLRREETPAASFPEPSVGKHFATAGDLRLVVCAPQNCSLGRQDAPSPAKGSREEAKRSCRTVIASRHDVICDERLELEAWLGPGQPAGELGDDIWPLRRFHVKTLGKRCAIQSATTTR